MSPSATLKFKNKKCSEGKTIKQEVAVLICTNAMGTEKREQLLIGKSHKSCSFKNVKKLPLKYTENNKGWIVADLFHKKIKNKMKSCKRGKTIV